MPNITIDFSQLPDLTNEKFYPLYKNKDRYLVLMGGGGSGKSVFTAQKHIFRMLTESGHRFLVLRKVAKTIRESVFSEIKGVISRWNLNQLFKINEGDLRIRCANGNEILFAGLDDVEKLKSIHGITGIWIEEASEINPDDYRQLDIRLRGKTRNYKQMVITFNPIDINHWLKGEFFDVKKPNCTTLHSTYKDNRFLDEEAKRVLESFKESDPYYYEVYCLGQWGVRGRLRFDVEALREYLKQCKDGTFGYLENGQFIKNKDGYLEVWEFPKRGKEYYIGADVAEGKANGDYSAAPVWDGDFNLVALWHGHIDPDLFGQELTSLGKWYNEALIAPEKNNHGLSTINSMKHDYWNLYKRMIYEKTTDEQREELGWMTTAKTKPLIINNLARLIREREIRIKSKRFIEECMTYIIDDKGATNAAEGSHDDVVMSSAIILFVMNDFVGSLPMIREAGKPSKTYNSRWVGNKHISEIEDKQDEESSWMKGWRM